MLTTLSKNRTIAFGKSAPPRRRESATPSPTESTDNTTLSAQARDLTRSSKLPKILATTLLATSALAGTAAAQTLPEPPVAEAVLENDQSCCQNERVELAKDSTDTTKFGVRGSFVNDNMPLLANHLGSPEDKTPSGDYFDDDGWTAEISLEANW